MKRGGVIFLSFLSVMTACAPVGPNYRRNDPSMPPRFGALEKGVTGSDAVGKDRLGSWWEVLKDPVLDALMERALHGNQDILIARTRVRQARALSLTSSSRYYPEGGFTGAYERVRRTESGLSGKNPTEGGSGTSPTAENRQNNLFFIGFDASWEIDLFGGVRREMEAAEADLAASEDNLRDTLVTLQGEVARNYVEYRGLQLRLDIARQEVKIRIENVQITEARSRAGFVSELDLARARGDLARAESRIPALEKLLGAGLHRLGVLLGREPSDLASELHSPMPLPRFSGELPVGLPSELLRRRPDIRRAEREIAAATARIGVSTAELFPKFSLTGTVGFQANAADLLLRDSSNFWSVGPTFSWPILNFKRILASIEFSRAVREEALARYEKTVLLSLEEVENSLVQLSREKQRIEALNQAVLSNELAVRLAMERYVAGLESYLAVTDAEAALFAAQDELAQSKQSQILGFVTLYKSLGGGWINTFREEESLSRENP